MTTSGTMVPPGLDTVVVGATQIGDVRGDEGFFHYRQYSATELARLRSFEDVVHLVVLGTLPDAATATAFRDQLAEGRHIPDAVTERLAAAMAGERGPHWSSMAALRTATALLVEHLECRSWLDTDLEEQRRLGLELIAAMPALVATMWRLHEGQAPIASRPELDYAADYLWMLTGRDPDPRAARALEQYLVTTIDHGFNASTFTARVVISTGADLGAAILAANGALSGPLHGTAPGRAREMLDQIGTPERAEAWVDATLAHGERIMGFGHRLYRTEDPRAALLREVAFELGSDRVALAAAVERVVLDRLAARSPNRPLRTNVEYWAGVVLDAIGLPLPLFSPTFAMSRTVGWVAHCLEQMADNKLYRPSSAYIGPPPPEPVPPR